jgi:hypothetical protein
MSAMSRTATTGRTNHVSPVAAAVALAGIVAVAAVGLAISQGVGTSSTVAQPAAGPAVVSGKTMSGPQTAAQKGLGLATPYGGSEFGAQYAAWLAAQNALAADFPDYFERMPVSNVPAGQIDPNLIGFPGYWEGLAGNLSTPYSGSDFEGQYAAWLKAQNAAIAADFPDYFQRIDGSTGATAPISDGRISTQLRLAR